MPAGFCGVVGLLPTNGRISYAPSGERLYGLSRPFALVRSMRDTALLLDLLSGPVPGDRSVVPAPPAPYRSEVGADPGPLRIGLCTSNPFGAAVDQAIVDGAGAVAATLEGMGHTVVPAEPPIDGELVLQTLVKAWSCALNQAATRFVSALGRELDPGLFEPNTWLHIANGQSMTAADALDVYDQMNTITRAMADFFVSVDVLITPTNPKLGVPAGQWDGHRPFDDLPQLYRQTAATFDAFMSIWNIAGQPAISLPLGHDDASGMPIATQLVARWGDETTLIRLGSALEQAMPWIDRVAPVDATMPAWPRGPR